MPRLLSLTTHGHLPQKFGGSECGSHALLTHLQARGWDVAVACTLLPSGRVGWQQRVAGRLGLPGYADAACGYPTYRRWHILEALPDVLAHFRPDVVVVQAGAPAACVAALKGFAGPVVVYLRDTLFDTWGGDLAPAPGLTFVATSAFVQRRVKTALGIDSVVVQTLIDPELFRVESAQREALLINPHPLKGGDLVLAMAERCPDIPFRIVECWALPPPVRARLLARAEVLTNVVWQASTPNIAEAYQKARVLLVPSQCDEAFARVIREAQYAGIPALASYRGGIPDVVGGGGILLNSDAPVEVWVDGLRRLWSPAARVRYSQLAREMAEQPSQQPACIVDQFLAVLEHARAGRSAAERIA